MSELKATNPAFMGQAAAATTEVAADGGLQGGGGASGEQTEYTTAVAFITLDGVGDPETFELHSFPTRPTDGYFVPSSGEEPASKIQQHSLSFHDITSEVTVRKFSFKKNKKQILKSVSGLMLPGLNAIMGPTGSGKTTLLDTLADRKDRSGLSGRVLIDGKRRPPNYKCLVGYVVQDDVVMGTLSVRENLQFSAALRLPSHMSSSQRRERVERVIQELGLSKCADTKIGTEFFRGVSGGERKRTNIGMELIIEPEVLFLDEPTTGLDAHTAVSVVQLLKGLSTVKDRIIVMSIHQPRYAIFKLFDTLTLLSLGDLVYYGSPQLALDYFQKCGFTCEEHDNPADFFLDTIICCEGSADGSQNENSESSGNTTVDLASLYGNSSEYQQLRASLDPMLEKTIVERKAAGVTGKLFRKGGQSVQYARNPFWQFFFVALRSAVNLIRNPNTSILQLVTTVMFAVIIGGIYFKRGLEPLGFEDRIGVFFFVATNQAFSSLSTIDAFIKQRALFIHENASGYYRVSAFFITKVLTDVLPLRILPSLFFALITYFMIGFQLQVDKFFIYLLVVWLTGVAAVSIAFFISASVRVASVANLLIAVIFVVSMLFGGLLIALASLPDWIGWVKYLSFIRYSIEAMAVNEISGLVFRGECFIQVDAGATCSPNSTFPMQMTNSSSCCTFTGLDRLAERGYQTNWLWYDILALVLFTVFFLSLAYLVLRLIKKEK